MTQTLLPARATRTASTFLHRWLRAGSPVGLRQRDARRSGGAAAPATTPGAAAYFETALAKHPTSVTALVGLGIARYRLGAFAEADRALNDALAQVARSPGGVASISD